MSPDFGGVKSVSEQVLEHLRTMIHSGQLSPGDAVRADEISVQLGVSRTPVRDAVRVLETEGLVEIRPRVGVVVRTISRREAADVYELKHAIEPLIARWAAERVAPEALHALERLVVRMDEVSEQGDVDEYAELVEAFHVLLLNFADSSVMQAAYRVISGRVRWLRYLNLSQRGRIRVSFEQHREVALAVLRKDPDAAYKSMAAHMLDAQRSAQAALTALHLDDEAPSPPSAV